MKFCMAVELDNSYNGRMMMMVKIMMMMMLMMMIMKMMMKIKITITRPIFKPESPDFAW